MIMLLAELKKVSTLHVFVECIAQPQVWQKGIDILHYTFYESVIASTGQSSV